MKKSSLVGFALLALTALGGMLFVQFYWFQKAFDSRQQEFDQRVASGLMGVARRISKYNDSPFQDETVSFANDRASYLLLTKEALDPFVLQGFLKEEMETQGLEADYEYFMYDCIEGKLERGGLVCATDDCPSKPASLENLSLPTNENYFGVHFPRLETALISNMEIWLFSTSVLIVVALFMGYSLYLLFRQRKLHQLQTDFVNNMAHELKTPIATVALSSQVFLQDSIVDQPDRLKKYGQIVHKEIHRLQTQVEKVLQAASFSQSKSILQKRDFSINDLLVSLVKEIEWLFQQKEIKLNFFLSKKSIIIYGDEFHLRNALRNLLENALKYSTSHTEVTISSSLKSSSLIIEVRDQGIGISPKDQKLIFQKFYRVTNGNRHDYKGFGLGLFYVKSVIEAHQGKVELESQLGKGSRFQVELPRKK